MPNWSWTRFRSADCLERYYHEYVAKAEPWPIAAFETGRLGHGAAEQYGRHCRQYDRETDYEEAAKIAFALRAVDPVAAEGFRDFYTRRAFSWAHLWARSEAVEQWLEADLPDGLGTVRGRLDFVQVMLDSGRAEVWDWKFSRGADPKPEDAPHQLLIYWWLLRNQSGLGDLREADLHVFYPRLNRTDTWQVTHKAAEQVEEWMCDRANELTKRERDWEFQIGQASADTSAILFDDSIPEAERRAIQAAEFAPLAEKIDRQYWPASPLPSRCTFCGHVSRCSWFALTDVVDPHPADPEAAQKTGQYLAVLQARAAEVKGWLREYCKENGPVATDDGKVWDFHTSVGLRVPDKQKFVEACRAIGTPELELFSDQLDGDKAGTAHLRLLLNAICRLQHDPLALMKPDVRAVKTRLMHDDSEAVFALEKTLEETVKTKFELRKPPEPEWDEPGGEPQPLVPPDEEPNPPML